MGGQYAHADRDLLKSRNIRGRRSHLRDEIYFDMTSAIRFDVTEEKEQRKVVGDLERAARDKGSTEPSKTQQRA